MARFSVPCLIVLLPAAVLFLPGCGEGPIAPDDPRNLPLHVTAGTVVQIDDEPFTGGGQIRFIPEVNTKYISTGELAQDGSFRLTTEVKGKGRMDGAPEGKYTVEVTTTAFKTGRARGMGTYNIASGENQLTVQIENPDARLPRDDPKHPPRKPR